MRVSCRMTAPLWLSRYHCLGHISKAGEFWLPLESWEALLSQEVSFLSLYYRTLLGELGDSVACTTFGVACDSLMSWLVMRKTFFVCNWNWNPDEIFLIRPGFNRLRSTSPRSYRSQDIKPPDNSVWSLFLGCGFLLLLGAWPPCFAQPGKLDKDSRSNPCASVPSSETHRSCKRLSILSPCR